MPLLIVNTSVPEEQIPDSLYTDLIKDLKEITGFGSEDFIIRFLTGKKQYLYGSFEPSAYCQFLCASHISKEENKKSSEKLSATLEKGLKIPNDRLVILFMKVNREDVGRGGTTLPYL